MLIILALPKNRFGLSCFGNRSGIYEYYVYYEVELSVTLLNPYPGGTVPIFIFPGAGGSGYTHRHRVPIIVISYIYGLSLGLFCSSATIQGIIITGDTKISSPFPPPLTLSLSLSLSLFRDGQMNKYYSECRI